MLNAKKIEEIAKQVTESIPPGLKSMANEFGWIGVTKQIILV